ncbi:Arm DNA-binding domain-containing protein, partial [Marinobacter sp.]|uniref:Arm DNA-binding domain-containing protein n=1 Tax=Marinobacter sp. TaxID=50741 RepID=UPI002B4AA70A
MSLNDFELNRCTSDAPAMHQGISMAKNVEKVSFSMTAIDGLKPTEGKRRLVWDSGVNGLGLRIMPTGVKTFFFQMRFNGEVVRVTIGRYTGTAASVQKARKLAAQYLNDINNGIDPRPEKKTAEAATFGDLLTGY